MENASLSTCNSQHQAKKKRKRKQNLDVDEQNDTFANNASQNNHDRSSSNHLPLNDDALNSRVATHKT